MACSDSDPFLACFILIHGTNECVNQLCLCFHGLWVCVIHFPMVFEFFVACFAALGHCCSGMEKCCSKGCSSICGLKCCPKNRPSPIFLSYTLLFNVPISVIALVTAIQAFGDDCGGDPWIKPPTYNLVMTGLSAFFIAFAIRVYMVLSASYDDGAISGMEAGTSQQPQSCDPTVTPNACCSLSGSSSYIQRIRCMLNVALYNMVQTCRVSKTFRQRVWYTACHDPFTFVYMFVFPFSLVWSIAGLAGLGEEDFEGCTDTEGGTWGVSTAMLVYLLCTCFVAMISCCWEVKRLRKARYEGQTDQPNIPPAQLATHMFVPNFSGKAGVTLCPPTVCTCACSALL